MAGNEGRYLLELWRQGLAGAMEYRLNFFTLSGAMMLNNCFWIFFWYLLMERFGGINGYGFTEMVLLYSVAATSLGILGSLFGDTTGLSRKIEEGHLDRYLSYPKNIILQAVTRLKYHAVGDFLFGIICALVFLSGTQLVIWFFVVLLAFMTCAGYWLLCESIAFFVGRFQTAARVAREAVVITGTYPFSIYKGRIRAFLLFVIPAGFIAGVPLELIQNFNVKWLVISIITALGFLSIGVAVFYAGLRRYESGNVISMRE